MGQIPGITCWEIENFLPVEIDEGKFSVVEIEKVDLSFSVSEPVIFLKTFFDVSIHSSNR